MGLLQKKSFHKMIFHDVKNLDKVSGVCVC